MVANKYAFLQITRRRFLNEWEAFKKVISRRNIRRRITIPLTLSNLKLLRRSEERFSRNAETDLVCRLLLEKKKKKKKHYVQFIMLRYHDITTTMTQNEAWLVIT